MSATIENEKRLSWDASEIEDQDMFDFDWQDLVNDLSDLLKEFNPANKDYQVNINNFGWRNLSGEKTLNHDVDGKEFLRGILPDTECTFNMTFKKDVIEIANYHHDSPTGENYYIKLK